MFKCDKCGKMSKPNETARFIVTEKREKIYHNNKKTGKDGIKEWTTKGWEIAKEMKVHESCI